MILDTYVLTKRKLSPPTKVEGGRSQVHVCLDTLPQVRKNYINDCGPPQKRKKCGSLRPRAHTALHSVYYYSRVLYGAALPFIRQFVEIFVPGEFLGPAG